MVARGHHGTVSKNVDSAAKKYLMGPAPKNRCSPRPLTIFLQAARRFLNTAQCHPHPILAENQPLLQAKSALTARSVRKSRAVVCRLYSSTKEKRFQLKYSGRTTLAVSRADG